MRFEHGVRDLKDRSVNHRVLNLGPRADIQDSVAAFPGVLGALPTYVAQSKGFFAAEGLDVLLVPLSTQGALVSSLVSGSTQVIPYTFDQTVVLAQKDTAVKMIAGIDIGVGFKLLEKRGLDLPVASAVGWQKTILALKGKTIGAQGGETSSNSLILKALMTKAGGSPSDLNLVTVNAGGATVAALAAGQVDVAIPDYGTAIVAEQQGSKEIFDFKTDGPPDLSNVVFTEYLTSDAALAKYPGLDQRFLRAVTKAEQFVKDPANAAENHKIAVSDTKIPESATLDEAIKASAVLLEPKPTAAQIASTMSFYATIGLVSGPMPALPKFVSPLLLGS